MTDDKQPLIYWDGYGLERHSGILTYGSELFHSLRDFDVHPRLSGKSKAIAKFFPEPSLVEQTGILNSLPSSLADQDLVRSDKNFRSAFSDAKASIGDKKLVYHGLSNINLPLFSKRPKSAFILTVHDLIPLIEPAGVSKSYHLRFRFLIRRVLQQADRVICVSEWTKTSLLSFGLLNDASKAVVIPNGVKPLGPRRAGNSATSSSSRGSEERNILFVARYEAYKGFDRLAQVIAAAPKGWRFVVVCDAKGKAFLESQLSGSRLREGALSVNVDVDRERLEQLYSKADLLLHLSRLEGFGLPVYEAMSRRLPVAFLKVAALETLQSGMGIEAMPLEIDAVEVVKIIQERLVIRDHDAFHQSLEKRFAFLPTWRDAAERTKSLYNEVVAV